MEPETKSNGSLVGLVVIIIILVVGGIYVWMSNNNTAPKTTTQSNTVTSQDAATLNALEQDANATNVNTGIDANAIK